MSRSASNSRVPVLLGCALLVGASRSPAREPASKPPVRKFAFTYEVTVPRPPEGARRLDAWVPTPIEDGLQEVADFRASATMSGQDVPFEIAREREYGNRMIHVGVDDPAADLVVQWTATITRTGDVGQGKGRVSERFLQADSLVPLEGEAAAMANELGLDDRDVPLVERARKAYDTVLTTMQYDKTAEGWGRGDFARACTVGKGNCTDFHAKFQGIARAGGIPVRFTMGVPLSSAPEGVAGGYHCWAHWHDGKRWRPVDISEAQKILAKDPAKAEWFFGHLDPDRVALTVGRDLTLAPPQAGKPLIFFAYPHVEVDGVEVQDPNAKEHRSLAWKNL